MNSRNLWLLVVIATSGLTCLGQAPDWWQAERDLKALLWVSNTPIAKLVSTVTSRPVADGPAAMFKVSVLMRAGMNEQAVAALHELKRVCPKLSSEQVRTIYYEAWESEAWDVAQAVVEAFAEFVTDLTLEDRLVKGWLESGWTVEQIDAWFAARPAGIESFWLKERLRFAQSHGRGQSLLQEWSDRVRRNPVVTNAVMFLDALLYARQGAPPPDLSWLADIVKPMRALDAQALAERLQRLELWPLAVTYYELAIAIPVTDREIAELGRMRQMFIPEDQLQAQFAANVREAMAECLLKLGQKAAAQQRLVEAADIREEHGLRRNAYLAGTVQAASGQRTVEQRMVAAEKKFESDPEYWRERAQYFRGRQDADREEEALKKGLSLTKAELPPERAGKGHQDPRSLLLSDYAQFLARHGRENEAVTLLRQELADAPALAESSARAAYRLAFDFSQYVRADDAVLWRWLEHRPAWEHTEERLLWRMLEKAATETLSAPPPTASTIWEWRTFENVP